MKRILALAVGGVLPVTAFLLALSLSSVRAPETVSRS